MPENIAASPSGVAKPEKKFPPKRKLTLKRQAFVKAVTNPENPKTFLNPTQAVYQTRHVTYGTAEVEAVRAIGDVRVRAAIEEELTGLGWTKERIRHELAWGIGETKKGKKFSDHERYVMDIAKLEGLVVEKSEVKDTTELESMRQIVNDALKSKQ